MPHITVTADGSTDPREDMVLLRERVNLSDFESHHFATQLVERLGWAVEDAYQLERNTKPEPTPPNPVAASGVQAAE